MYNHRPEGYHCPFCQLASGVDLDQEHSLQSDLVYKDEYVMAFIARDKWPNNPGHVLIAPVGHYENIYDLPDTLISKIHSLEKLIALGIKQEYRSDGVSSRQHNEPDGGQDVWHYHLAVFPRYKNDELYLNIYKRQRSDPQER
ncbi:HIT family protein, partial [Candidatus Parcubacteria bacterium]|nr:HIT family protein [Candidatus Parcubacteria bacterium]